MIHLDDVRNSWFTAFLIDLFIFYQGLDREKCI